MPYTNIIHVLLDVSSVSYILESSISLAMIQQEPLVGGVPVTSHQPVSKYESARAKTALIVMISVLATSAIFMGVILGVMHRAQPQVERAQLVLGRAEEIMDYPSRVLHGNVFHVANNLLQTNWLELSRNTTKLTTALQQIFNAFDDYDRFNIIAKYASLATSIASKIGWIKPNWSPSPSKNYIHTSTIDIYSEIT